MYRTYLGKTNTVIPSRRVAVLKAVASDSEGWGDKWFVQVTYRRDQAAQ